MPTLPVNIDSTYSDAASDTSRKIHQQHHDTIHAFVNRDPGGSATLVSDTELAADIATHAAVTTSVHGITDTSALLTDSDILDEDDFASNSAVKVPSQQSTKAYIDTNFVKVIEAPLSLARYTTTDDGSADVATAVQNWLNALGAATGARHGYIPAGNYRIDTSRTIPDPGAAANPSNRFGGIKIEGAGMYSSVLNFQGTGYLLSGRAEALEIESFSIKSTTGGGLSLTEGGNLSVNNFFMDGCGATYWGLYADTPYPVHMKNCRFWHTTTGYAGGAFYIDGAHSVHIDSTFVSKQQKDGDCCILANIANMDIGTLALESLASGGAFTSQVMLSLQGTNTGGYIGEIYGEGQWNKLIQIVGNSSATNIRFGSIRGWQRDTGSYGIADCYLLDAPSAPSTIIDVGSTFFTSDVTTAPAGDGYLINDTDDKVRVGVARNESGHANQSGRKLKKFGQTRPLESARLQTASTTSPSTTFTLPSPGTYLVSLSLAQTNGAHARVGTYLVTWDDRANDFTSAQLIGTQVSKGGSAPSVLNCAVDNAGVVTVSGTSPSAVIHYIHYGWRRLMRLDYA